MKVLAAALLAAALGLAAWFLIGCDTVHIDMRLVQIGDDVGTSESGRGSATSDQDSNADVSDSFRDLLRLRDLTYRPGELPGSPSS